MKIELTREELHHLLEKVIPVKITGVVIVKSYKLYDTFLKSLSSATGKSVSTLRSAKYFDDKIGMIKALRVTVPNLGLAEGKWITENWTVWLDFLKTNSEYPTFDGNYPSVRLVPRKY